MVERQRSGFHNNNKTHLSLGRHAQQRELARAVDLGTEQVAGKDHVEAPAPLGELRAGTLGRCGRLGVAKLRRDCTQQRRLDMLNGHQVVRPPAGLLER